MSMIDRSLLWTGGLNEEALGSRPHRRVGLYDTTLRDGEQTVGVVLSPENKLEIARMLDEMGVDRIEAGFPRVSDEDWRAVELVANAGLKAEIWGFSRALPADVEAIVTLGMKHTVIEAPVSEAKLKALGVDHAKMLQRITSAVSYAAERDINVAYFGVDGSRAEMGFLKQVYQGAVKAGAREVVVVDTMGILSPEATALMVQRVADWVGPEIPVHYHGHNDFGLALATSLAAVHAGASWVHGTINGMGERAGNTSIGEVALALDALYGIETGLRLPQLRSVSARVTEICGYALEPWKSLVGENLYRRETGTVASQFHEPPAIEPFSSQLVGAQRSIVLGKKSGIDSIRIKSRDLGLDLPEEQMAVLLTAVKAAGTRKRGLVTDEEFRAMVNMKRI